MRILIATDAWHPQINGVVRTYANVARQLEEQGITVRIVSPDGFPTVPCPTYPEIALALPRSERLRAILDEFAPDGVHIATEGPIGFQMRRAAMAQSLSFTTSFHTRFPEYLRMRAFVPLGLSYEALRRFHRPAKACLVATRAIGDELAAKGFHNLVAWTRGVDTRLFRPGDAAELGLPRPVFLTVSRVAREKNLEAFLDLDLPGSKLVVGDGPELARLAKLYPRVHFAGAEKGEALVRHYNAGDVFVFPSRTDTFGNVILEALACGVPVAAFPEPGPLDILSGTKAGCLSSDLRQAALGALEASREDALRRARDYSWSTCADILTRTMLA